MGSATPRRGGKVISAFIDSIGYVDAADRIMHWAGARESRFVCACNVHVAMSAHRDSSFRDVLNRSDLNLADGAPVAFALRRRGFAQQERIAGPDLFLLLCERAAKAGTPIYLYGSTDLTLARLIEELQQRFPNLVLAGAESPPFRSLTPQEDAEVVERINASKAGLVFVGLGCPKQELWMARHKGEINGVMVGVGAAFDFVAGTIKRAPVAIQRLGLEWLHRLFQEPRRLWRRYLVTNSMFVALLFWDSVFPQEDTAVELDEETQEARL